MGNTDPMMTVLELPPQVTYEQAGAVQLLLRKQKPEERELFARMLGLTGEPLHTARKVK